MKNNKKQVMHKGCVLVVMSVFCSGCFSSSGEHQYEEVVTAPTEVKKHMPDLSGMMSGTADPHAGLPGFDKGVFSGAESASPAENPLAWTLPVNWVAQAASGMRLATLSSGVEADRVECSVIRLSGMAGGLKENLRRWMGQIHIAERSDAALDQFLKEQESFTSAGGLNVQVIDFTSWQKEEPAAAPSIVAAIVSLDEETLFLKMVGEKQAVLKKKEQFLKLCRSLKRKS